jgi:prevent-host-death family protein
MAKSIGAYEAKTNLSAILEEVRRGERYTITRHGLTERSAAKWR